jgi:serine/threonine protein kinase
MLDEPELFSMARTSPGYATLIDSVRKEAALLGTLDHQGVCACYGVAVDSETRESRFLVLELADCSLDKWLVRKGGVTQGELFTITDIVFQALAHLHSHLPEPVIHGEIRPSNVLVIAEPGKPDRIQSVKLVNAARANFSTYSGDSEPVESLFYTAPEVFKGDITVKADVFSAGVLISQFKLAANWLRESATDGLHTASAELESAGVSTTLNSAPLGQSRKGFTEDASMRVLGRSNLKRLDVASAGLEKLEHKGFHGLCGFLRRCLELDPVHRPHALEFKAEEMLASNADCGVLTPGPQSTPSTEADGISEKEAVG